MPHCTGLPFITFAGTSSGAEPMAALRAALGEASHAMAAVGASPGEILSMTWTARTPAAIHPAQSRVDLSFREIFGGLTPSITVRAADHDGVKVELRVRRASHLSTDIVWEGFTLTELARAYSPRATVGNMAAIFDAWRADGTAFRTRHLTAELAYGPLQAETLDLYLPPDARGPRPLWIFIHGGYWQAIDKAHNAQFAAGMLEAGYAVAMLNYSLAPAASLAAIVDQIRRCVSFLAAEAAALGCDPHDIHIAGHSAGGHLAAMIVCGPEGGAIRSCLALSGLFDLAPLACLPMGRLVRFDQAEAIARLSPRHLQRLPHVRIGVAVGGNESSEFHRQSIDFAAAWGHAPCRIVAGKNHFDLLDGLNGGELLDFARAIAAHG